MAPARAKLLILEHIAELERDAPYGADLAGTPLATFVAQFACSRGLNDQNRVTTVRSMRRMKRNHISRAR